MEKKISIITPVYNGEQYIEQCILSILNQNYQNFEHIIVDGGSTDSTLSIVEKYSKLYPMKVISEKDNGMYDAIAKGFRHSTGQILAWLNSDDTYMPWAFRIMNYCIDKNVDWCTAISAHQDSTGTLYKIDETRFYNRRWIKKGLYGTCFGFIQQESTFWSRELWDKASGENISRYKLCGDYWLWKQFAKHTELYSVDTLVGCFRHREGQLSQNIQKYWDEAQIAPMHGLIHKVYLECESIQNLLFKEKNKIRVNIKDI